MEEQDKDLKEEVNENEDPSAYGRYNWDELMKKLLLKRQLKKERKD